MIIKHHNQTLFSKKMMFLFFDLVTFRTNYLVDHIGVSQAHLTSPLSVMLVGLLDRNKPI